MKNKIRRVNVNRKLQVNKWYNSKKRCNTNAYLTTYFTSHSTGSLRKIVWIDKLTGKLKYVSQGDCTVSKAILTSTFKKWSYGQVLSAALSKCKFDKCCNRPKYRGVCRNHAEGIRRRYPDKQVAVDSGLWDAVNPVLAVQTTDDGFVDWYNSNATLVAGASLCWCGNAGKLIRGLCNRHYMRVTSLIRNGYVTLDYLTGRGKLLVRARMAGRRGLTGKTKGYGTHPPKALKYLLNLP